MCDREQAGAVRHPLPHGYGAYTHALSGYAVYSPGGWFIDYRMTLGGAALLAERSYAQGLRQTQP